MPANRRHLTGFLRRLRSEQGDDGHWTLRLSPEEDSVRYVPGGEGASDDLTRHAVRIHTPGTWRQEVPHDHDQYPGACACH